MCLCLCSALTLVLSGIDVCLKYLIFCSCDHWPIIVNTGDHICMRCWKTRLKKFKNKSCVWLDLDILFLTAEMFTSKCQHRLQMFYRLCFPVLITALSWFSVCTAETRLLFFTGVSPLMYFSSVVPTFHKCSKKKRKLKIFQEVDGNIDSHFVKTTGVEEGNTVRTWLV